MTSSIQPSIQSVNRESVIFSIQWPARFWKYWVLYIKTIKGKKKIILSKKTKDSSKNIFIHSMESQISLYLQLYFHTSNIIWRRFYIWFLAGSFAAWVLVGFAWVLLGSGIIICRPFLHLIVSSVPSSIFNRTSFPIA